MAQVTLIKGKQLTAKQLHRRLERLQGDCFKLIAHIESAKLLLLHGE